MQKNLFLTLIIWCLCVTTSCSPMRSQPYTLPNPIFAAFTHQIDLQPLRDTIAKDSSFQIQAVDDGFVLYAGGQQASDFLRFWMNDSLLIYQIKSMPYTPFPPNNGLVGKVILEAQFRKNYPTLATDFKKGFPNWRMTTRRNKSDYIYQDSSQQYKIPFKIDIALIQPVETLSWQGSAFGNMDQYKFQNGVLHGTFHSSKKSGLEQTGIFQNGIETGIWQYKNKFGQLQYIKEYAIDGSLKKVVHQRGATFSSAAPIPTLRKLKSIHLTMMLVLILLSGYILFKYFKALRNFKQPYKGLNKLDILFSILLSPILSFCGGILVLFLTPFLANILRPIISWDLPVDFLVILPVIMIFVMVESALLLLTNRLQDIAWHALIMIFGILMYHEWKLLIRLEQYL